jgi:hypothetical protein
MSRIKILSRKIFNHKLLRVVAGWLAFLCGHPPPLPASHPSSLPASGLPAHR